MLSFDSQRRTGEGDTDLWLLTPRKLDSSFRTWVVVL